MRRKYEQVLTRCNYSDTSFWSRCRRQVSAALLCCVWTALAISALAQEQQGGDLDEFFRSVTDGRVEIVREGLRRHPDWANAELFMGIRPVYRASVLNRDEVLAVLLEAGAEVNAITDRGTHPLHAAAQHGYPKIMERLLAAGATVDAANDAGQTPLFLAVRNGHEEMVERLIAKGASTLSIDGSGRTPLIYAAGLGQLDCVRLLVENGAEVGVVDDQGFSALGLCRTWKRNEFEAVSVYLSGRGAEDVRPKEAWEPEPPAEDTPAAPGKHGE